MKKRTGTILAVIGYVVLFYSIEGWGTDWKYIGKDVGGSAFFDTETIKSLPNGNFMVWAKKVHSKEGISEIVKQYGEEYRKLTYTALLVEVDCKNIRSKAINSYYYSKEGAVISYINAPDADWDFYPPGSIGELFIKGVCKQIGGADWRLLGSNAVSVCYYDSKSITRPSVNIVKGSKYCSFTEEAKTYFAGTIGKTIEGRKTLENMSYSIDLWEIHCKNKVVSLVSVTLYSKEGKVVGVEDHTKSPVGRSIVPTSLDDLLYKEVCK